MGDRSTVYGNAISVCGKALLPPNAGGDQRKDYREGLITVGGKLLSGKLLYGASCVPCIYTTAATAIFVKGGHKAHAIFDVPKPDLRRIRLPYDGRPQPKPGGEYLNAFALVSPDMALGAAANHDRLHSTNYTAHMKAALEYWNHVATLGNREEQALLYAQFYKTFFLVFKLSMVELQRIPLSDVIAIFSTLYFDGPQEFFRPREYRNLRYVPLAPGSAPPAPTDADADDNDGGIGKKTISIRIPFQRAVSLFDTYGRIADPEEEELVDAAPPGEEDGDGEDDAAGNLRIGDLADVMNVGGKRGAQDAGSGSRSGPVAKRARTTKLDIEADGISYLSSRQPKLPVLTFRATPGDVWIQGLVYDCLHRSYYDARYFCVESDYWKTIVEQCADDFPTRIDIELVWKAIFHLVAEGGVVVIDQSTMKEVRLDPADEEDAHDYAAISDNTDLVVAMSWAYYQEVAVARGIENIMKNSDKVTNTKDIMQRALYAIDKMFVGSATYATRKLASAQFRALIHAIVSPFTVIHGPGGTGKSMVMCMITRALRLAGYHGTFLYTQFKNDTTDQTKRAIMKMIDEDCATEEEKKLNRNCEFATIDSVTFNREERGLADFQVVFVDEAGMESTSHLKRLFDTLNPNSLTKMIKLGDELQLEPIGPGMPLQNIVEGIPETCVLFTQGFRAKTESLMHNLNCIRNRDIDGMIFDDVTDTDNGSFFLYSGDMAEYETHNRKAPFVMDAFLEVFNKILTDRDPERKRYADIRGISQFRDYARLMAMTMQQRYFDDPISQSNLYQYALESKEGNKIEPTLHVGSRVVVRKADKKNGLFMGYVGEITAIFDHPDKHHGPASTHASTCVSNTAVPSPSSTRYRTVMLDDKISVTVYKTKGFKTILVPAGATTCHSMQGRSGKEIIGGLMPQPGNKDDNNTHQSNRMLYTLVSRSEEKCFLIAPGDQLGRMVTHEDVVPPSNLPRLLAKILDRSRFKRIGDIVSTLVDSLCTVIDPTSGEAEDDFDAEMLAELRETHAKRTDKDSKPQPRYECDKNFKSEAEE